jgi:hypothetical protein
LVADIADLAGNRVRVVADVLKPSHAKNMNSETIKNKRMDWERVQSFRSGAAVTSSRIQLDVSRR